jgi:Primosomal protein N'' (replication factor Y) - superfamily II helicase
VHGVAEVASPMPCPYERLAGRYRFELMIKDSSRKVLPWALAPLLKKLPAPTGVRRRVDVDPVDMM